MPCINDFIPATTTTPQPTTGKNIAMAKHIHDEEEQQQQQPLKSGTKRKHLEVPPRGFNFQPVEEAFVRTELNRLKTNKAIGLDKISARLLKDSASLIAPVLTKLFNRSLESSKFPSIWKFGKAGFTDATITWFKSYLYQRIQVTRVDNATSSAKYVSVGVPQGSVLGPLLFILYVNDLPSCIKKCKVTMYADDTVLYFSSSTLSELEENLNADLEILRRYLNDNPLTLNAEKSKFVIFGSTRKLNSFREFSLEINAHNLERRDTFKYLGIKLNQIRYVLVGPD
ncbi:Hypothetical predicted protein [Paramuricea clavata]|uniref:Uncharacterized protein n=1 Tax=Paramuricea clavata TaxID=317549 RepID=A0A6S7HVP2_PARCT|nr:Hypothetical predicted protein [Paramuricea clavata]